MTKSGTTAKVLHFPGTRDVETGKGEGEGEGCEDVEERKREGNMS